MDEVIKTYMPQMLTGYKLDEALRIEPEYDKSIMMATEAERLISYTHSLSLESFDHYIKNIESQ